MRTFPILPNRKLCFQAHPHHSLEATPTELLPYLRRIDTAFFLMATAILHIETNGLYRTHQWKCSHCATVTASPTPMQPIPSKNKSQSQSEKIADCERALTVVSHCFAVLYQPVCVFVPFCIGENCCMEENKMPFNMWQWDPNYKKYVSLHKPFCFDTCCNDYEFKIMLRSVHT